MQTQKTYEAQVVRPVEPEDLAEWYEKRGIKPDENGIFTELPYRGDDPPTEGAQILENVRVNAARRDVPNLHPREYTPKTLVYLGGGPTLVQFLDEIKQKCEDENYDVVTSNKTCKWLLSKGVKPNFHLILDPQEKKLKDLEYEENVDLILSLACHPGLFEFAKLKGRKVHKFLAFSVPEQDGRASDKQLAQAAVHEGDQTIFCIGGGSMTGTRMIYFAAARGYRRLEYYGFDGHVVVENNVLKCYSYSKMRGENILITECEDGRKFHTTMSMGRQAEELVKLYNEYPALDIEIYGDSLLSHTLKLYRERCRYDAPYRISENYKLQLKEIHKAGNLGVVGGESAARVFMAAAQVCRKNGMCRVLDYGSGQGALKEAISRAFPYVPGINYHEYDPAIEGKDVDPGEAELVFCGDVMEHVEPECVDAVFKHIAGLTKKIAIFEISLEPAVKTLPDGRNAHLTVRKPDWWMSYLRKYFIVVEHQVSLRYAGGMSLFAVCQA